MINTDVAEAGAFEWGCWRCYKGQVLATGIGVRIGLTFAKDLYMFPEGGCRGRL